MTTSQDNLLTPREVRELDESMRDINGFYYRKFLRLLVSHEELRKQFEDYRDAVQARGEFDLLQTA